jgi:outer membrane protein
MSFNISKKDLSLAFIIFFVSVSVSISVAYYLFNKKVAYVRTGEIISKYKGMSAANQQFKNEVSIIQSNVDTLRKRFETLKIQASQSNDKALWYQVGVAEKEYQTYSNQVQQDISNREKELTSTVLNTINNSIQKFGKDNNYELILGTTNDGSVLYGKEYNDVTNKVLDELNKAYTNDSLKIRK